MTAKFLETSSGNLINLAFVRHARKIPMAFGIGPP
jgi:hypothetical protein